MGNVFDDVQAVAGLLSDFGRPWAFCGGWAIDLFLGRVTRTHKDVDVAIARRDQLAMQEYLTARGWQLQIAHDGVLTPWQPGAYVELPRHGIWASHPTATPDLLEILLNEIEDGLFRFRRDQTITRSLDAAFTRATNGLPILAPEIALLYKSTHVEEEENRQDFDAALPLLDVEQRSWLRAALVQTAPAHRWIAALLWSA